MLFSLVKPVDVAIGLPPFDESNANLLNVSTNSPTVAALA